MKTVLERLEEYSLPGGMQDWEIPMIQAAIEDLQKKGWTDDEIVSKLKWLEHVNPEVEEDVALRCMKRVDEQVAARLAAGAQ